MNYFVYKLVPPRPTFAEDMTEHERAAMIRHVAFWTELARDGTAVVFGPVVDPAGGWGLAVFRAASSEDAHALTKDDPAVVSGVSRSEIYSMPQAILGSLEPSSA